MAQDTQRLAPFSAHHAFVVHFRVNSEVSQRRMTGRVEQIVSGQSTHFASLEKLVSFRSGYWLRSGAPPRMAAP
jgi:hypothetical protein